MVTGESDIKAFYIFNSANGSTFLSGVYTNQLTTDPDLATGLLAAMYKFAHEANLSDLRIINLSEMTLLFIEKKGIIFAVLASKRIPPVAMISKLETVATLFLTEYSEQLKKSIVDTEDFIAFRSVVEDILGGEIQTLGTEDTSVKATITRVMAKTLADENISGMAIIGSKGEAIVNYIERDLLAIISSFLTTCFENGIYSVDSITLRADNHDVMTKNLGKGLMLTIATRKNAGAKDINQLMDEIYKKIIAVLS